MNRKAVAMELVTVAKELAALEAMASVQVGSRARLTRDVATKSGNQFLTGEELKIESYADKFPWTVRLVAPDGRKLSLLLEGAWRTLSGFPKPPGMSAMERWSEDGVAKAVDGARVEPDGFSPSGAPSWMLVMGMI